jgi:flavin reductase (DIM6/NTAB) family NADH-FMN oxidoreductase RutF
MEKFKKQHPAELTLNAFEAIGGDWMLVAAGDKTKSNTMTASWGGLGVMWNKNVAYIVLRPTRYTKEFVDAKGSFSLSFLPAAHKKTLNYLGAVSGRDEDKIAKSGLTQEFFGDVPYFGEAHTVLICKKLFAQPFEPKAFLDPAIEKLYPQKDYHTLYIGQIIEALTKA